MDYVVYLSLGIIVITAFMLMRVRIQVEYSRTGSDDHVRIEVSLLRDLIRYRTSVPVLTLQQNLLRPLLKVEAELPSPIPNTGGTDMVLKVPVLEALRKLPDYFKLALEYYRVYKSAILKTMKKVRFHEFTWKTEFGLGDPADTGMAAGLVWGIKGILYSIFRSNIGVMLRGPRLSVVPCFNCTCLRLDFRCIFDIRIGHIIITGLNFVKLKLR